MSNAAIYARVSSAQQKEQETIGSQTAALRAHAGPLGLDVPEQWVFEDDGHPGASLVRPALERTRDLVCQVPLDVLLVHSPDRLARKYACHAPTREFPHPTKRRKWVRAAPGPYPPDRSRWALKGRTDAGSSPTPLRHTRLRHTRRTHTIWQYWHVPALSGLFPPSPAPPGSGCPQLHHPAATGRR